MIVDIWYYIKSNKGFLDSHLIRCFEISCERKGYLESIEELIQRKDIDSIIIRKYE